MILVKVVTSGVLWLLNYQTSSGSFLEFGRYRQDPLHFPMRDKMDADEEGSLALTAHVLITLQETMPMLKVILSIW